MSTKIGKQFEGLRQSLEELGLDGEMFIPILNHVENRLNETFGQDTDENRQPVSRTVVDIDEIIDSIGSFRTRSVNVIVDLAVYEVITGK